MTPRNVLPTLVCLGVVFIAVGAGLYVTSEGVTEYEFDYTNCKNVASGDDQGKPCAELIIGNDNPYVVLPAGGVAKVCKCEEIVEIADDAMVDQSVFMYYALTNYYQNHRRYVKSRDDPQMRSVAGNKDGNSDCAPYQFGPDSVVPYAPCGIVANSLFNDTIQLARCTNDDCTTTTPVELDGSNIAWKTDVGTKFKNPTVAAGETLCTTETFKDTLPLPSWRVPTCEMGTNVSGVYYAQSPAFASSGVGYENEDFIVWMRTAALPDFRKLYRHVKGSLSGGKYKLFIDYNYPVTVFKGTKGIVLSTTSWMGGKNPFLGICYLIVGSLMLLFTMVFLIVQRFKGRELGSDKYLSWDRE